MDNRLHNSTYPMSEFTQELIGESLNGVLVATNLSINVAFLEDALKRAHAYLDAPVEAKEEQENAVETT